MTMDIEVCPWLLIIIGTNSDQIPQYGEGFYFYGKHNISLLFKDPLEQ